MNRMRRRSYGRIQYDIGMPSELLLGIRYILIKDFMIAFIEVAFSSGLMDAVLSGDFVKGITAGVASGALCSLTKLFSSINSLDERDFLALT